MTIPNRASGILLHPTSLPGPYGIGSLGDEANRFVDYLVRAGQTYWQILPLGPTGYGDSPYSTFCSVAGNPLLIDLEYLVGAGDLEASDLCETPEFSSEQVDYGWLIDWKRLLLQKAARRFLESADKTRKAGYESFCEHHATWLDDYALFVAIKEDFEQQAAAQGKPAGKWNTLWDKDIALREPKAVDRWREKCADTAEIHKVWQYYFFSQWKDVRDYANERGIVLIGDMPIFVASDSADVWVDRSLFLMDEEGQETFVAGVPPDYFSETGQRWGNPLYNWDMMADQGFEWWVRRFKSLLELVDVIRIDHFRGFESCWAVPAEEETAVNGEWVKVPGLELFETVRNKLGRLPILAEDLGLITPEVEALRDRLGFPGMRVLQFGFNDIDPDNPHVPYNHVPDSVVYTGTHDNDTTGGWFAGLNEEQRSAMEEYLRFAVEDPAWDLIRVAMASVARAAIIPMQDVLGLGNEARMNRPGEAAGNWTWRLHPAYADNQCAERLAHLTRLYGRMPPAKTP